MHQRIGTNAPENWDKHTNENKWQQVLKSSCGGGGKILLTKSNHSGVKSIKRDKETRAVHLDYSTL